jgi:uroporphyrinogen III methyltransferase/synthase
MSSKKEENSIKSGHPGRYRLDGRAIMITRAQAQSVEITDLLQELGGEVIHCPTVECIGASDTGPLDSAIDKIDSFDWIVFTSANAVTFFCNRLIERQPDGVSSIFSHVICAIGPATAKVLTAAGVQVDIVASDSRSEGVLAAIIEFAGGPESLSEVRILIPRARIAREVLPTELSRLGAKVETVEAYQTVRPDIESEKIIAALQDGIIDAITFTSPSTVSNFATLAGTRDLSTLLRDSLVACIGPVTAAAARAHGIRDLIQPEKQTTASLVEAIATALGERG